MLPDSIYKLFRDKLKDYCSEETISDLTESIKCELNKNRYIQFLSNENKISFIDIEDIFYITDSTKNSYLFVTSDGEFEIQKTKICVEDIINNNYYQLDKKTIVNMKKIKKFNGYMGIVYFGEDIEDKKTRCLSILIKAIEIVEREVGKVNDVHRPREIISDCAYSPLINRKKRLAE